MVYCDECQNFPDPDHLLWKTQKSEHFKCMLKIRMLFKLPRLVNDDDWGFYKKECLYFAKKEYNQPLHVDRQGRWPKLRLIK